MVKLIAQRRHDAGGLVLFLMRIASYSFLWLFSLFSLSQSFRATATGSREINKYVNPCKGAARQQRREIKYRRQAPKKLCPVSSQSFSCMSYHCRFDSSVVGAAYRSIIKTPPYFRSNSHKSIRRLNNVSASAQLKR